MINTAATMRVLNVLRHWVSKHSQDFECDPELKAAVKDLLEEMVSKGSLTAVDKYTFKGSSIAGMSTMEVNQRN